MRLRPVARYVATVLCLAAPLMLGAQESGGLDLTDGLAPGSYLRIAGGMLSPVHPSGSLRDWNRGSEASVDWENWLGDDHGGPGLAGFGLIVDYGKLPLNENQFVQDYEVSAGTPVESATAHDATIWSVGGLLRLRIPAPFIMPSVLLGFGVMGYSPAAIDYTAPDGTTGSAKEKGRSGADFSIGAGLDKHIYGRVGIFGEALYEFGYTNIGGGIAVPGAECAEKGCDALTNTPVGTIRGGVRVRLSR